MSRVGTIARRTFLVASAAVVGGVAFGYYLWRRPLPNPLEDGLAEGEAALTPFVLVTADGITLIAPRHDSGTGVADIQARLIAEELDVDPDTVTVDPGRPAPAYYNSAVLEEGFPYAPTDESLQARLVRGLGEPVAKLMGLQITGGSSTVPDMFERLRVAGAVARETLKAAAAQRTGTPVDQLSTADGAVVLPDGTAIPYTDLAAEAAGIEPVQEVALRPASQWRTLGKESRRLDMVAKSTGTQVYGIDLAMEGMVHATVRTNPAQGGGMARVGVIMSGRQRHDVRVRDPGGQRDLHMLPPFIARLPVKAGAQDNDLALSRGNGVFLVMQNIAAPMQERLNRLRRAQHGAENIEYGTTGNLRPHRRAGLGVRTFQFPGAPHPTSSGGSRAGRTSTPRRRQQWSGSTITSPARPPPVCRPYRNPARSASCARPRGARRSRRIEARRHRPSPDPRY